MDPHHPDSPAGHVSRPAAGRKRRRRGRIADDTVTTAAAGTTHFGIAGGGAILTNQVQPAQPFRSRPSALLPVHDQAGRLIGYAPVHALGADPAPACTVCASGCRFTTIEAAVAAAAAGDTITVAAGAYAPVPAPQAAAYLAIERPLTLKACVPGQTVTVLCPMGAPLPAVCIAASGAAAVVTVEGIDVEASPSASEENSGFVALNGGSLTVRDVASRGFAYGMVAYVDTAGSPPSTIAARGRITIAGITAIPPVGVGIASNGDGVVTVSGNLSITNMEFGLFGGAGTLTCLPPISYTATDVTSRCDDPSTIATCPCT